MSEEKMKIDVLDAFACAAMQKLLVPDMEDGDTEFLVAQAYNIAEAMMEHRQSMLEKDGSLTRAHTWTDADTHRALYGR